MNSNESEKNVNECKNSRSLKKGQCYGIKLNCL